MTARRFVLERHEDMTGVSGTGTVAEGIEFTDGIVVLQWIVGDFRSISTWVQGIEAVAAIHGHDGKTEVKWVDPDENEYSMLFCTECGKRGVPATGDVCILCGQKQVEPFREGWDESD